MYIFLLTLQIYHNNKIKVNNTSDTTKTCPCFSFFEKIRDLKYWLKNKTKLFLKK